jgi:hypothetical protein
MDWWNDLVHWLAQPASNGTLVIVLLVLGSMMSSASKTIVAKMGYLGSVLEAIANHKPWPW